MSFGGVKWPRPRFPPELLTATALLFQKVPKMLPGQFNWRLIVVLESGNEKKNINFSSNYLHFRSVYAENICICAKKLQKGSQKLLVCFSAVKCISRIIKTSYEQLIL